MQNPTPEPVDGELARLEADPKRPWKAYVTAVGSAVLTFVAAWVADSDPFTAKEAATAGVSAIVLGGGLGGITFSVRNPIVSRRVGK